MSLYLKFPQIQGSVVDKSHHQWIALDSAKISGTRHFGMPVGDDESRQFGRAGFDEIVCVKQLDKATGQPHLNYPIN